LAAEFSSREAEKHYWAIVEGDAQGLGTVGVWDDWLADPDEAGIARIVPATAPRARRGMTRYSVGCGGQSPPGTSWLRLWPETGRTHQLRVQAAARGLPIVGDAMYGASRAFPRGIALHARALRVRHPTLRTIFTWVAPVPAAWHDAGIALPDHSSFD
jgi:23S rRNA pseudouridine1911/1915/1917 synthase